MVLRFSLPFYKMKCENFASIDLESEALGTCTWVNLAINLLILHTFLQIFTVPIYLKSKHNISFSDGLCLCPMILTFYFSSDLVIRNNTVLAPHTQFLTKFRGIGDTGHPPS